MLLILIIILINYQTVKLIIKLDLSSLKSDIGMIRQNQVDDDSENENDNNSDEEEVPKPQIFVRNETTNEGKVISVINNSASLNLGSNKPPTNTNSNTLKKTNNLSNNNLPVNKKNSDNVTTNVNANMNTTKVTNKKLNPNNQSTSNVSNPNMNKKTTPAKK